MKKILLIEDEKTLSDMYCLKLKQEGFEVLRTIGAEEGIELAKKEKPDLILLDILLPKMDGISALKILKRDLTTKSIPVLIFSNLYTTQVEKEVIMAGAECYLLKTNYTPSQVVKKIKSYLNTQ